MGEWGGGGREVGARETQIERETEKEKQRLRKAGRQTDTKLVFLRPVNQCGYIRATDGQKQIQRNRDRETATETQRERELVGALSPVCHNFANNRLMNNKQAFT